MWVEVRTGRSPPTSRHGHNSLGLGKTNFLPVKNNRTERTKRRLKPPSSHPPSSTSSPRQCGQPAMPPLHLSFIITLFPCSTRGPSLGMPQIDPGSLGCSSLLWATLPVPPWSPPGDLCSHTWSTDAPSFSHLGVCTGQGQRSRPHLGGKKGSGGC